MVQLNGIFIKKTLKLIFVLVVVILIFYFMYFAYAQFHKIKVRIFSPEKLQFNFEHIYSDDLKNQINDFVFNNFKTDKLSQLNPEEVCNQIKSKFDFIKNVIWDFSYHKIVKIHIIGVDPICIINDKIILTNNGYLVDFDFFKSINLKLLKSFYLNDDNLLNFTKKNIFSFIEKIPIGIWLNYQVYYLDPYNITLKKMENDSFIQSFFLVTQDNCLKYQEILRAKNIVKLINKNQSSKKNILMDTRFRDRVYVKPMLKKELELLKNMGRA
ncbi:hypothetical protein GF322_02180 [Candidatus Dependentiae bacterium]|nr:hypothetical protein [Candidatus Dependentiae bacterium]